MGLVPDIDRMIYYDITKMGAAKHRSGLMRLSSRLLQEMGAAVVPVSWDGRRRAFVDGTRREPVKFIAADWLFTVEMFCEAERPGISAFVQSPPCRLAAMFHDAIPVRFPHITWPQSVQRHPEYMKLLAGFERTWAISADTRRDFIGFWRWQEVAIRAQVEVIGLGADFDGGSRVQRAPLIAPGRPLLLCVGIVEPRKNQSFLLGVAEALWRDGVDFELHVVGRINPHFGKPIAAKMKALQKREKRFQFHAAASDRVLRVCTRTRGRWLSRRSRKVAACHCWKPCGAGCRVWRVICRYCGKMPMAGAVWSPQSTTLRIGRINCVAC